MRSCTTTTCLTRSTRATVKEDQDNKDPGVNTFYADLVHNDLNDNSGRVRCRELLTKNLRNFGRTQHYTEAEADAKMARRFMSINLAKPMETVGQHPFVLCAWPSFADQPYITNYRIYDDRVGETTRFTYRPAHEWYWFPQQTADRGLDAQVLRLGHRRFGLALVVPHCLHRPHRARRRSLPQERRGPLLCLLLGAPDANFMKGVSFLFDERGERQAVLIDLKKNSAVWEDFYDAVVVREREHEARETLREAKQKILGEWP